MTIEEFEIKVQNLFEKYCDKELLVERKDWFVITITSVHKLKRVFIENVVPNYNFQYGTSVEYSGSNFEQIFDEALKRIENRFNPKLDYV